MLVSSVIIICTISNMFQIAASYSYKVARTPINAVLYSQSDYQIVNDATVGIKKRDLEELNEFVTANDQDGFLLTVLEKMKNGSAFRISKGTMVRVLDLGFFYVKIRVLNGPNKNRIGYMDREFIKK